MDDALRALARQARTEIRGGLRGAAWRERLLAVPVSERDGFVDAMLGLGEPPADEALPRGAVPYLPCGVAEILAAVAEAPIGPGDDFVDIGAGLGRVVMLVHLLTGARACGVEVQAPLVAAAEARARTLGLDVTFVHANAAETTLEGGVFFLYAPCNGELLRGVLGRLEAVARRRPITLCVVDCVLPALPWLRQRTPTMYEST
jgi:hypothetical protein